MSADGHEIRLTEAARTALGPVGVIGAPGTPVLSLALFEEKAQSTSRSGKGAVSGAVAGLGVGTYGGVVSCLPLILTPAFAGCGTAWLIGGTAVGATLGAVAADSLSSPGQKGGHAPPPELRQAVPGIQAELSGRVAALALRETSLRLVEAVKSGAVGSREEPPDAVLELGITRIAMPASSGHLRLEVAARATLKRVADGQFLAAADYRAESAAWPESRWLAADGELVLLVLERALDALAEEVVQSLLVYDPGSERDPATARPLRKISPTAQGVFVPEGSFTPTLRWVPFPRAADLEADRSRGLAGASGVTYDLRVYRALSTPDGWIPGELVYARTDLPDASHRIEDALAPCSRYFWTQQARFEVDSQKRASRWSNAGYGTTEAPAASDARDPLSQVLAGLAGVMRDVFSVFDRSGTAYPAFLTACTG